MPTCRVTWCLKVFVTESLLLDHIWDEHPDVLDQPL